MTIEMGITPHGHLHCYKSSEDALSGAQVPSVIGKAFEKGIGDGLFALAARRDTAELPSGFRFWGEFACIYLTARCNLSTSSARSMQPELLFRLRGVNHEDMVGADIPIPEGGRRRIKEDIGDVFGVDLESGGGEDIGKAVDRAPRPARKKKSGKPTEPARTGSSVFRGKDVVKLRGRLGLNTAQFARLAGVSVGSVRLWESREGTLDLRKKSVRALEKAAGLKKPEARKKLGLA